ncbi:hypothetical protein B484DRAFT_453523 [Ochromonadaceae sp. CCMP2298]|nr:hypothetical protein B484DRAFT_453523 [Ochromonadaceae sp. CCMP2298]
MVVTSTSAKDEKLLRERVIASSRTWMRGFANVVVVIEGDHSSHDSLMAIYSRSCPPVTVPPTTPFKQFPYPLCHAPVPPYRLTGAHRLQMPERAHLRALPHLYRRVLRRCRPLLQSGCCVKLVGEHTDRAVQSHKVPFALRRRHVLAAPADPQMACIRAELRR